MLPEEFKHSNYSNTDREFKTLPNGDIVMDFKAARAEYMSGAKLAYAMWLQDGAMQGKNVDCYVESAWAYKLKSGAYAIGIVSRVRPIINLSNRPIIAGEYVVNRPRNVQSIDPENLEEAVFVDHQKYTNLKYLNHILYVNGWSSDKFFTEDMLDEYIKEDKPLVTINDRLSYKTTIVDKSKGGK